MDKKELLENLEYALKGVLCHGLEGIDRVAMESSIELFVREKASGYSEEELIEKFYTPEMSIRIFTDFLAENGALEGSGEYTIQ